MPYSGTDRPPMNFKSHEPIELVNRIRLSTHIDIVTEYFDVKIIDHIQFVENYSIGAILANYCKKLPFWGTYCHLNISLMHH